MGRDAAAAAVFAGGVAICDWRVARLQAEIGYVDLATSWLGVWGLRRSRRRIRVRKVVVVLLIAAGCGALAAAPVERHWPNAGGDDIGWISAERPRAV